MATLLWTAGATIMTLAVYWCALLLAGGLRILDAAGYWESVLLWSAMLGVVAVVAGSLARFAQHRLEMPRLALIGLIAPGAYLVVTMVVGLGSVVDPSDYTRAVVGLLMVVGWTAIGWLIAGGVRNAHR